MIGKYWLLIALGVTACGEPAEKPAVLFKDQRQVLDKAKAVDATVNQQAQQQREQIDDVTQK